MNTTTQIGHSNIALVKYWGKHGLQLPMNPSISMTLQNAKTTTTISWNNNNESDNISLSFKFEGKENKAFANRLLKYIDSIKKYIPCLKGLSLDIESSNSFPHSAGIASSASAFSAFAKGLIDIEHQITGKHFGSFASANEKASYLARLGSGSASRSIYNGFSLWGKTNQISESSDEYAIPINHIVHDIFKSYNDAILIISKSEKKIGSTVGHALMNNHPFATERFKQAKNNTFKLLEFLKTGHQSEFVNLVENEALSLHAMMMTSSPAYVLMEPNTLQIINKIQDYRNDTSIQLCFTLDAGANVHLLYPEEYKQQVQDWIKNDLLDYCENRQWLDDCIKF